MALTNKQIQDLDRMNEASARMGGLGTYLANLEAGISGNLRTFSQTVTFEDFTKASAGLGKCEITAGTIPVGATFLVAQLESVVGFAGDTSATLTLGNDVGGGDVDRYNTSTANVFATAANGVALGAPSGVTYHAAEGVITAFVTSATDFDDVTAGSLALKFYYLV